MSQNVERLVKKTLQVTLSQKELIGYGNQVAQIHSTLAHTRFEAKESAESFRNRIAGLQDDLNEVMTKLRDGKELREVDCLEVKDFDNKRVNYIYQGEVLESHPLKDEDRQITIF